MLTPVRVFQKEGVNLKIDTPKFNFDIEKKSKKIWNVPNYQHVDDKKDAG